MREGLSSRFSQRTRETGHPSSCQLVRDLSEIKFPTLSQRARRGWGTRENYLLQGDEDLDYAVTGGEWFEGFAENGSDHFGFVGGFHGVAFFGGGDEEVAGLNDAVGGGHFAGDNADDGEGNIRLGSLVHGVGAGEHAGLGGIDSGDQRGIGL